MRRLVKAILSRIELQRIVHKPSLQTFLEHHRISLVIDIGANTGQFGKSLRHGGYRGRIHSFEPINDVYRVLEETAANDPLWMVTNAGIGAAQGEATINVAELSVFSSIKPVNAAGKAFDSRAATARVETVSLTTLLDVLDPNPTEQVFVKIDTQGFEREVLQGAAGALKLCEGIQLELPIQHLYDNVWSISEAIAHMEDLGFVPAQFEMVNTLRDDESSGVEFDCIFRRVAKTGGGENL